MTRQSTEYEQGLKALGSASGALDAANLEHWFFGGWAVDLWVGRVNARTTTSTSSSGGTTRHVSTTPSGRQAGCTRRLPSSTDVIRPFSRREKSSVV